MAANISVVKAYASRYSETQLNTALDKALDDHSSGVQMTQVTFEGGGANARPISGNPDYLIELLQAAIEYLADPTIYDTPPGAAFDLSKRPFST